MTKIIYKYALPLLHGENVKLPIPGVQLRALHFAAQEATPAVWVEFTPSAITSTLKVTCVWTGHPYDPKALGSYMGTVPHLETGLVCHYYGIQVFNENG